MANFKLNGIKYQRKNKTVWDQYREELERNGFVILKKYISTRFSSQTSISLRFSN